MAFTVFVDACVLFSAAQRDILVRIAGTDIFRIKWSDDVLAETARNLQLQRGLAISQTDRLIDQMTRAFPDACISQKRYASLVDSMTVNPKARHVLAAAIVARADVLVTWTIIDFPVESCAPYGIYVQTPDDLLVTQAQLAPQSVLCALEALIHDLRKPSMTVSQWLEQQRRYSHTICSLGAPPIPRFRCYRRFLFLDPSKRASHIPLRDPVYAPTKQPGRLVRAM